MTEAVAWYRSGRTSPPPDLVRPSRRRRIRAWLRDWLPEPHVRGRTMVLYCRQGLRSNTSWPGMFSEFVSVLGALSYGEERGAAALRVDFRSPHYLEPSRGPNWWTYYFDRDTMQLAFEAGRGEVHLDRAIAKYGRFGGFGDRVNGATPHLYPMTAGLPRAELHRLVSRHIAVRPTILAKVDAIVNGIDRDAFVVGVHYRGTDTVRHYPYRRTPYESFATEARRTLEWAGAPRYQLFIASDETDFVEYMDREFPGRVVSAPDAPRVRPTDTAIHFNRELAVSGYEKGESALVDCLLLARTNYLIKGRSSLSDVSLMFNAQLPYSFCLG
jgi:hypothetical protein